ncbi:hypothetical protein H8E07_13665 [bacterium]|nr:hypothetical protein [bacterium]
MHERGKPLEIADEEARTFVVDMGAKGPHRFYTLDPLDAYDLAGAMNDGGVGKLAKDAGKDLAASTRTYLLYGAAIVGVCWAHPDVALDTEIKRDKNGDLDAVAIGRGVSRELHLAGYSPTDLFVAYKDIYPQIKAAIVDMEEVGRRVDFSDPKSEPATDTQ